MKVIIFADGLVGEKFIHFLMDNFCSDVALVVTAELNEIYQEVTSRGFSAYVFDSEEDVLANLDGHIDLGILAWWPRILSSRLVTYPKLGFINTHPSFLPYNRGKHFSFWAIVENAPFGVTLHKVDKKIDGGEIVAQSKIYYDWLDSGGSLYHKAQMAMLQLIIEMYPQLREGNLKSIKQDLNSGSFHYASEIEAASRIELDKYYTGRDLINLLRARTFEGYPGCWFEDDGNRYEISIKISEASR